MKFFNYILIPVSCFLAIISCQDKHAKTNGVVIITDMLGRAVEVPKNVTRVVGVKAGTLRMLSYLGATGLVVGVEEIEKQNRNPYNLANPEYKNLPVIGPIHGGDAELIALTHPDVIFMTYATIGDAGKLQNKTGTPVVALHYGDMGENKETFYAALKLMAKVINKSQRADSLINYIEYIMNDLEKRTKNNPEKPAPEAYIGGISFKGMHGISSTDPEFAPFKYIHANNLASKFKSTSNNTFVDKEQIIEWNPKKIFIDYAGWGIIQDELKEGPLAQTLDAVKKNEVYLLLPYNCYTTNYATIFVNAYYAGSILYPESFSDITLKSKANEIYNTFLNKPVYDEIIKQFGEPIQVFFNNK